MAWFGVDLGTQSVRAVLVDDTGDLLGRGRARLSSHRWPDGRHEQGPESWWTAAADATRQALAEAGPVAVDGLACCAPSGTGLLVEESAGARARPLPPGLMYDAVRAAEEAAL